MTSKNTRLEKIANIAGIVGVIWFALVAGWGMFGSVGSGHYAASAANALSAENMLTWKIIAPYWDYTTTTPPTTQYYCHHPFMTFWDYVPLVALFGHKDWILYLPAVFMSGTTGLLINRTANNAWGPLGAMAATWGFAVLPICLAFSNFSALEGCTMFGWALFFWGQSRMLTTWKKRYMFASALGVAFIATTEWIGYVVIGMVLAWTMLRILLPTRLFAPIKIRRYAQWWVLCCTITCGIFAFWVIVFFKWGTLVDMVGSSITRSSGGAVSLHDAIEARRYRVDICFTSLAILVGKIAAPIAVIRLIVLRRDEEFFSVAALTAATIHYVGFKQGADIHVFWSHYFAMYFAFALAQLVLSLRWVVAKIVERVRPQRAQVIGFGFGLAFTTVFVIAMFPDSIRGLYEGRATWGRFNEERLRTGTEVVRVLEIAAPGLPAGAHIDAHPGLQWSWHMSWAVHGMHNESASIGPRASTDSTARPYYIARTGLLSAADLQSLVRDYHAELYDDVILVDRRRAPGPLDAFVFEEHEPNPFEWYFFGGTAPVKKIVHDEFATWEWRTHLGQIATLPTTEPRTPDQLRIAHNIAVAANDMARATALRAQIDAMLRSEVSADYSYGVKLVGIRNIGGSSPRVQMWFLASGPTKSDAHFSIHARMTGPLRWSFVPPDSLVRDISQPMPLPTNLWRPGFLYTQSVVLYHRTGVETFDGAFWAGDGTAPVRIGGPNAIDLLTLR